jgi:hypothetical protein
MCGLAYIGTPAAFKEFDAAYDDFAGGFELKRRRDSKPADAGEVAESPAEAPANAAKEGKPAPEPPKLEPNTVAGRITDVRGNVIEEARLLVQVSGTTLAGERTNFDIEVDDNGLFSQEVPDGLWRIYGFIEKEYNGHKYRLPLDPEDNREIGSTQGTRKGVVKNFVWKVAGLKPRADKTLPGSYYGGSIDLTDVQSYNEGRRLVDRYPGAKVVVTLKPKGLLIDGSQGKPVKVEADVAAADAITRPTFMDIPLGEYVVTAQVVAPNGASRPLNIAAGFVRSDAPGRSPTAVVAFYPPSAFESLKTVPMSVWE